MLRGLKKGFPEEWMTQLKSEEWMGFTHEKRVKENIPSRGTHLRKCLGTREGQDEGLREVLREKPDQRL